MILMRVEVHRAAAIQATEAARELRQESLEVVGAHLVHGDEHDQRGNCEARLSPLCCRARRGQRQSQGGARGRDDR